MEKPKRFWLFFAVGVPAVCCLGGALILVVGARSAHARVEQERAEARGLGMPLTMAEMNLPGVPDSQNAASLYLRAHVLLSNELKTEQTQATKASAHDAKPEDVVAGRVALDRLSPVFLTLSDLPKRPACNFNRNWSLGPKLTFPALGDMKSCVRDECLKADVQDGAGDWKGGLKTMRTAYRIAQDSGSDPILIGLLVQVACRSIVNAEYESLIGRHTRDRAFLEAIDSQIRAESSLPDIRRAMSGEVAFGLQNLRSIQTLRMSNYSSDPDSGPKTSAPEKTFYNSPLVQDSLEGAFLTKWMIAWREFPQNRDDWAGFGAALKDMDKAVEADASLGNRVNQVLLPTFTAIADVVGTLQARERLLLASIAVLKARLDTGRLPVVLPASLGELRRDPFDSEYLRYRPQGSGFLLYSVGRDRIDDGGRRRSPRDLSDTHFDEVVEFQ